MRPGTFLGWTSALCTLLIAALLAGGLHWALTTAAAYPTPAAQTVNQNDAYDVTTAIGVMAGVALPGLGACTALVLWLHHRTTRPVAAGRRGAQPLLAPQLGTSEFESADTATRADAR